MPCPALPPEATPEALAQARGSDEAPHPCWLLTSSSRPKAEAGSRCAQGTSAPTGALVPASQTQGRWGTLEPISLQTRDPAPGEPQGCLCGGRSHPGPWGCVSSSLPGIWSEGRRSGPASPFPHPRPGGPSPCSWWPGPWGGLDLRQKGLRPLWPSLERTPGLWAGPWLPLAPRGPGPVAWAPKTLPAPTTAPPASVRAAPCLRVGCWGPGPAHPIAAGGGLWPPPNPVLTPGPLHRRPGGLCQQRE